MVTRLEKLISSCPVEFWNIWRILFGYWFFLCKFWSIPWRIVRLMVPWFLAMLSSRGGRVTKQLVVAFRGALFVFLRAAYCLLFLESDKVTVSDSHMLLPDPFRGIGAWRKQWSPRSRATLQGLDQEISKESVAGQCRMRWEVSWDECPQALQEGFSILPILER